MRITSWFHALACTILLAACVPMATMTTDAPAPPAAISPVAPADAKPSTPAPALTWPERFPLESGLSVDTLRSLRRVTTGEQWLPMGAIMPLQTPVRFARPKAFGSIEAAEDGRESLKETIGRLRSKHGLADAIDVLAEGNGAFIVEPVPARQRTEAPPTPRAGKSNLAFQFVTLKPIPVSDNAPKPQAELQRTAFFYYDPALGWLDDGTPIDPLTPKGLVVLLPGMFGTPGDQIADLVKLLRQRGYAVLRMMAHPSRFTETIRFAAPLDSGEVANDNIDAAAFHIGRELGDRAAECAYAIETAVAYVRQERPSLSSLPLAAVGMSGGAMVLPTVAARDPKAWSALAFIGGGADYLRIMTTSNYSDWINAAKLVWVPTLDVPAIQKRSAEMDNQPYILTVAASLLQPNGEADISRRIAVMVRPPAQMSDAKVRTLLAGDATERSPTPAQLNTLFTAYRRRAPLDSANLVPLLGPAGANVPSLLIVGTTDRAVPAATGEELWQLLGKPERWSISGGHEWLFLTLPSRLPKLADWLDTKLVR